MRFALSGLLSLGLLALAGCANGGGFMAACGSDSDCDEGLVCGEPSAAPESSYCTSSCSSSEFCRDLFGEERAYCAAGAYRCRVRCDTDSDCPGDARCPDICRVPE